MDVEEAREKLTDVAWQVVPENPDTQENVKDIRKKLNLMPEVREALRDKWERKRIQRLVWTVRETMRAHAKRPGKESGTPRTSGKTQAKGQVEKDMNVTHLERWDTYQIGDKRLRNAPMSLLMESAGKDRAEANGKLKDAQFKERLAERLDEGQEVEDEWTLEEVIELYEDIWGEAEEDVA